MFDLGNPRTLDSLEGRWKPLVAGKLGHADAKPAVVVGNKLDLLAMTDRGRKEGGT